MSKNLIVSYILTVLLSLLSLKCSTSQKMSVSELNIEAKKFNNKLVVTNFPKSTNEIENIGDEAIRKYDSVIDEVVKTDKNKLSFENTFLKLQDADIVIYEEIKRIYFIWYMSPHKELRDSAQKMIEKFQKWSINTDFREDLYNACKQAFQNSKNLKGEDLRLVQEIMRNYKRSGLHLSKQKKDQLKALKKEVSKLSLEFNNNIKSTTQSVEFNKSDLKGVPSEYLEKWKQKNERFKVNTNVYADYAAVVRNASLSDTRKKMSYARDTVAVKSNLPLLKVILFKRLEIAKLLGYKTWAAYRLEEKMAKDEKTVNQFLSKISSGMIPKVKAELQELKDRKQKDFPGKKVKLNSWDIGYYSNKLAKEKYNVDTEKIKEYFEMNSSIKGMFRIYEKIFHVKFQEVDLKNKVVDDIKLYVTKDAASGEPLGLFYTDLYPREGKYKHFMKFSIQPAGRRSTGQNYRPTVALIGNFDRPTKTQPSLLTHSQLETLFHEFGHVMHSMLTRSKYTLLSGSSVPRDFVEAPSQMLENWVWDKKVLDTFAVHYKEETKIPSDLLDRMKLVKKSQTGRHYSYQLTIAEVDMYLHSLKTKKENIDLIKVSNEILYKNTHIPAMKGTGYVARIGHLMGYDAGYYGYLWAEAISQDMASIFENSKMGYFDQDVGLRLRNEIYSQGNSRDVNDSIKSFLKRERSYKPFLKKLGLNVQSD